MKDAIGQEIKVGDVLVQGSTFHTREKLLLRRVVDVSGPRVKVKGGTGWRAAKHVYMEPRMVINITKNIAAMDIADWPELP